MNVVHFKDGPITGKKAQHLLHQLNSVRVGGVQEILEGKLLCKWVVDGMMLHHAIFIWKKDSKTGDNIWMHTLMLGDYSTAETYWRE